MTLMLLPLLAIIGLAAYVFQEGRDDTVKQHRGARWIMLLAFVPLAALIAFSLLMGIGEMIGDELGGVFHLFLIIPIGFLAWLAWLRPVAGGATLAVLGTLLSATFWGMMNGPISVKLQAALITGMPFLLSGLICLVAAAAARQRSPLLHP